jgi:hypothetical protein
MKPILWLLNYINKCNSNNLKRKNIKISNKTLSKDLSLKKRIKKKPTQIKKKVKRETKRTMIRRNSTFKTKFETTNILI